MTPKRRYTFWINEKEADGLKQVKSDEGIAESEQVRQAIRDWLRKKGVTGPHSTLGKRKTPER
jgi:hypothetical protein